MAKPQMNVIEPTLVPWKRIAWTKPQEQKLYRDWGIFFSFMQQPDIASRFFDKSLDIKKEEPIALYFRSLCKIHMAKCEAALTDALLAAELEPYKPRTSEAIADAYYGLNEFEQLKVELHDITRKYHGSVIDQFLSRIIVVNENFKDNLGDTLKLFLRKHEALIDDVAEKIQKSKCEDKRPLWKKLKDEHKCDVLSILEQEKPILSPLEIARRNRTLQVFYQIYLGRSWSDVMFMRSLKNPQKYCMPHFKESSPFLCNLVTKKYWEAQKFIKMLHTRSPLYSEWIHKYPNRKLNNQHREAYLNFVQNRTRRDMFIALRKIKEFRKTGSVLEFAKYVEHIMGDFVILKTQRVMPWRFEFMHEVYNSFALALIDRFRVDKIPDKNQQQNVLFTMLRINSEPKDRPANFAFGDRASYFENDNKFSTYKKFIARFEKRMIFAKHSIEKCYLLHGIAAAHFLQARYDECCELSRKAIEESNYCDGRLWAFLCSMLIVRSHAALQKIERCKDALVEAHAWANVLKDDKLINFIETINSINDLYIDLKKRNQSTDTLRKRRSSMNNIEDSTDDEKEPKLTTSNYSQVSE